MPLEQIHAPDELCDEARRGSFIDRRGIAQLFDASRIHHRDAVGHDQRLALVVRHEDRRDAEAALDRHDLDPHFLAQLEVEIRQRLVEQQHRGIDDERARERHPLALAAGHLQRTAIAEAGELDEIERVLHALRHLGCADAAHAQSERDVFGGGHVRKQRVVLEHDTDVAPEGRQVGDRAALQEDLAGRWWQETRDEAERGRLAAARGPEQRDELALLNREVDAGHGRRRTVVLLDSREAQRRLSHDCARHR